MKIKTISYIKEKVVGNISPSTLLPPHSTKFLWGGICLLLFLSCSSIDCPMNNTVSTKYALYKSDGTADTLRDTLTVITLQRTKATRMCSISYAHSPTCMRQQSSTRKE